MVTLKSSDGVIFQVDEAVFTEFRAIHGGTVIAGSDGAFPLPQVTGETLAKVIDYCKKHIDHKRNPLLDAEINAWDRDFVDVDEKTLLNLLVSSHSLGVKELLNLTCYTIMEKMKGTTPDQRRNMDQLRNLFTQMQILL